MRILILGALPLAILAGCSHNPPTTTELETNQQKASYASGMFLAEQLGDTLARNDLNPDLFLQAVRDRLKGNDLRLSEEEARAASSAYQEEVKQRVEEEKQQAMARNAAQGQAFMEQNKQRPSVKTLSNGLQYEVLKESSGGATPDANDAVRVHYAGTLIDGTFVESSLAHGEAVRVNMGVALKGWQQALTHMKEGEKWRLFIPPELAYGEKGLRGKVPPQSTLIYELQLVEVIDRS
ncbi:FKBP-type peptidyl-prolyl cis-trans isomerase [Alloalcanivorax marinus]|uniref:FKBP-type peptidyl-prolyl cis-trans isomerase n=1 Tax=Alloalcanivorax marinus TaxID=1177169 RepID=UPI001933E40B|nr:FKBP-type peptidyl-prolyl cis-trans isomerase [Alloalcanivorax marinus]MBL7250217.1 FKBP-type peptidyl-prolyl cis-trans isomerase [Alloalcanivorax marinus]